MAEVLEMPSRSTHLRSPGPLHLVSVRVWVRARVRVRVGVGVWFRVRVRVGVDTEASWSSMTKPLMVHWKKEGRPAASSSGTAAMLVRHGLPVLP